MADLRVVGHLDADSYYCSAERVRFDFLRGRPLAVLGNQGVCVIARSYEMREFGVKVGEPVWEAIRKCPDGAYLKRDFRWYEALSRRMLDLVRRVTGRAEYYSVDEFFFDATPPRGMDHAAYATYLRDAVLEEVGVPVTVGIGRSRTIAKLISDSAKPFGSSAVLDRASEEALLAGQPIGEISGIAGRRERKLAPWGIYNCLEFARADRRLIRSLLTADGEALWWELNGEAVRPIRTERPARKVVSRGGSFGGGTSDPHVLFGWLVRNLERLIEELRYHDVVTGRVVARVGYRDGRSREGRASLDAPSNRFDTLLDAFRSCLRAAWIPHASAGRMHLLAHDLVPKARAQLGLFSLVGRDVLTELKHRTNRKFGRFALRSAATLAINHVYGDPTLSFDICDIPGKMCF